MRTTSGATAVQISEYVDGHQRIVKHVGSAHPEVELGILMAKARELLEPDGQGALDLGVEATVPVRVLLAGSGGPTQPELFPSAGTADAASGRVVTVGAARVVATDTRTLFEALEDQRHAQPDSSTPTWKSCTSSRPPAPATNSTAGAGSARISGGHHSSRPRRPTRWIVVSSRD